MDLHCQKILKTFHGNMQRGYCLEDIIHTTHMARQTVFNHLKHLLDSGLITREPSKQQIELWENPKRGRPTILYRKAGAEKPKEAISQQIKPKPVNRTGLVYLDFNKLKHACRFEKGGNCKEKREKCAIFACPLIAKS